MELIIYFFFVFFLFCFRRFLQKKIMNTNHFLERNYPHNYDSNLNFKYEKRIEHGSLKTYYLPPPTPCTLSRYSPIKRNKSYNIIRIASFRSSGMENNHYHYHHYSVQSNNHYNDHYYHIKANIQSYNANYDNDHIKPNINDTDYRIQTNVYNNKKNKNHYHRKPNIEYNEPRTKKLHAYERKNFDTKSKIPENNLEWQNNDKFYHTEVKKEPNWQEENTSCSSEKNVGFYDPRSSRHELLIMREHDEAKWKKQNQAQKLDPYHLNEYFSRNEKKQYKKQIF